jgi:hypothetical protein
MTFFIALSLISSIQAMFKYLTRWHLTDKEVELKIAEKEKEN